MFNPIKKYYAPSTSHNGGCNIDVSNCEHYFMLYIDNELNETDKQAVEQFLQQNPSTEVIFNELQEATLGIDALQFNKNVLYKQLAISEHNYEEYIINQLNGETTKEQDITIQNFINENKHLQKNILALQHTKITTDELYFNKINLYKTANPVLQSNTNVAELLLLQLDGQTTTDQSKAIQQLINSNAFITNEWQLLQNTIIPSEVVLYPNKESLYKKEKKEKPFIAMWLRYAAAACLLLGVTYTTLQLNNGSNSKTNKNNVVANNNDTVLKQNTVVNIKNSNPQVGDNKTQVVKEFSNITLSKSTIVKNELTPNKIVTNNNNPLITNTTGSKKVLTNNNNNIIIENKVDEQNSLATTKTKIEEVATQLPAIKTNLQSNAAALQQKVEVNYYVTDNANNVSFLNIDAEKIDKKNKLGKFKNRVVAMLKDKAKGLGNDVTIAGYNVAFSKAK